MTAGLARILWTPDIGARMRPGGIHEPEKAAGVHAGAEGGGGRAREEHGQDGVPGVPGPGPDGDGATALDRRGRETGSSGGGRRAVGRGA